MITKKIILFGLMLFITLAQGKFVFSENEVLLLNDFGGASKNRLGGIQGGDGDLPGLCFPTVDFINSGTAGPTGECLNLTYDVKAAGSFTFYWMKVGPRGAQTGSWNVLDLSKYHYLGFWVRGEEGSERFKIEVHQDTDGDGQYTAGKDLSGFVYIDYYLKKGVEKKWNKALIPLEDFKRIGDWTKVLEIVFTFENFANIHKSGTIYVEDILFGTSKIKSDTANPVSFNVSKESFKIDDVSMRDGIELDSATRFEVSLNGNFESVESVWVVVSNDGFSWKTIGKSFSDGKGIFKGELNTFVLDRSKSLIFDVWAFDALGQRVTLEKPFEGVKFKPMDDNEFLDELQKRTFQFFWEGWNSETGLMMDATHNEFSSIASTGFGISAFCLAAERGWISKEEVKARVLKTIDTFLTKAENRSGFFYHFLNPNTASRFGTNEISVVDTAILVWGLLSAGEYFGEEIKAKTGEIYKRIVWKDFLVQDSKSVHYNHFYMGWNPEGGPNGSFLDAYWDYYSDEVILINLLAVGSPTHPVDPEVFYAWKREKGNYGLGRPFVQSWHGGLFAYQYAHHWIDFNKIKDRDGVNWWQNTLHATVANRQFCIDHMDKSKTYGRYSWGVSSMAFPNVTESEGLTQIREDYTMSYGTLPCGTGFPLQDGTVAPSASAGSAAYMPDVVVATLKDMVLTKPQIWGPYGFRSAYNLDVNWFSTNYYGIDLGNSLMGVENSRNAFFWNLMKKNQYLQDALKKVGFVEDLTEYQAPVLDNQPKGSEISSIRIEEKNLIVEDFDDTERVKTSLGIKFGSWDKDPQDTTQKATVEIDTAERHNNFGASLKVEYDVDSNNPAFNGIWMKLNGLDATSYKTLEFWVKGSEKGTPVKFKVELKGEGQMGSTYINGIEPTWKKISIPLEQFRGLTQFNQLNELTVVFEDHAVGQKTGTIYLDDIQFGNTAN